MVWAGKLVEHGPHGCCLGVGRRGEERLVAGEEGGRVDVGAVALIPLVAGAVGVVGGGCVHGGLMMGWLW